MGAALCANVVTTEAVVKISNTSGPNYTEWKDRNAADAAAKAAVAAKQKKMAAVNKVISMLESLQAKVLDEGEKEAHTYNKFACFCKDTTAEKTAEIKAGQDEQSRLTAHIAKLSSARDDK